ncbi:MAG: hypothetical protein SOR40_06645 [Rothia sp. (in: high G+C Gram-positive bacteria)]|nr:hypothetical protein [Rothia sp. (in: high G+C Gram-positive bacteria)]
MAKKKVTALTALAATALLAGCAQTVVPGMGIVKTDGWGGREDITFEVTAQLDGAEVPATVTVYQDQISFDGNSAEFEGEAFYKVTYDDLADLTDSQLRISVSAQDPAAEVSCAVKGTGYALEAGDHVNHANEAEGTGSATCVLNVD